MDERELKKEYVMYLRDNKLEHLDCEMLFEMIKYFEGLGKNKYDEALERARRILCNVPEGSASARDIETIFPDLRESEDERIRKEMIDFLKSEKAFQTIDLPKSERWIAYLEKQKEPENTSASTMVPSCWEVEQKEPHYTKRNALFDKCVENCDPKTVEEVNKRVDDIMNMSELSAFEQALTNFIGYWEDDEERWPSKFVKKHCKHILDMAREELQKEQKPAEWSEEDEKMLKCCLIAINHYEKTCNIGDHRPTKFNIDGYLASVDKVKSWLKSLRPSWKPSEEQMSAFKGYIEEFQAKAEAAVGGWNNFDVMIRLYEQLKKLKEE